MSLSSVFFCIMAALVQSDAFLEKNMDSFHEIRDEKVTSRDRRLF